VALSGGTEENFKAFTLNGKRGKSVGLNKPHLFSLTQHRFILNQFLLHTCKDNNRIEINLCCFRLNKCGLFSNKHNGMASIKRVQIW